MEFSCPRGQTEAGLDCSHLNSNLFIESLFMAGFPRNATMHSSSVLHSLSMEKKGRNYSRAGFVKASEPISGLSDHQTSWSKSVQFNSTLVRHTMLPLQNNAQTFICLQTAQNINRK